MDIILLFISFCDKKFINNIKNTEIMRYTFAHTVATIMQYSNEDMAFMKKKLNKIMLGAKKKYRKLNTAVNIFIRYFVFIYSSYCLLLSKLIYYLNCINYFIKYCLLELLL